MCPHFNFFWFPFLHILLDLRFKQNKTEGKRRERAFTEHFEDEAVLMSPGYEIARVTLASEKTDVGPVLTGPE